MWYLAGGLLGLLVVVVFTLVEFEIAVRRAHDRRNKDE